MAMPLLPDSRTWTTRECDSLLLRLTLQSAAGDQDANAGLMNALRTCIAQDGDDQINEALRASPSAVAYRHLWKSVCAAVDHPPVEDGTIVARPFAIPLVLVTRAKRRVTIPGSIPDITEVTALLESHGAVGPTRNFGLSNGLSSQDFLDRLKPGDIRRWTINFTDSAALREVHGQDIEVAPGREQVHLRFLIGAGIASPAAPSFVESATNIGFWGIALTRLLTRQLGRQDLDVLPLPRPAAAILEAGHNGRSAALETAFSLFVSNTVRKFRASVGDPLVIISSHLSEAQGAELRVSISSELDDTLLEGFRWPLHALDDFDRTTDSIIELLRECRIADIHAVPQVLPGLPLEDHGLFLTARDLTEPAIHKLNDRPH